MRRRVIHPDKVRITFKDGQSVKIMGNQFQIMVSQDPTSSYSTARIKDGVVNVRLAGSLSERDQEKHVSGLSRRAITRSILPQVESRVRQLNNLYFQSNLSNIRLKDNLSNWGSCSRENNINLDFRLLFGPSEIFDAVILHELAHTKHRNHSKAYYNYLLAIMPDNRERLRWLRDNGHKLTSEASGTVVYPTNTPTVIKETPSPEGAFMN
ncbi:MAG: DUF45 domain-containing protein [Candidatus Micrarchaeota archaeon]|nr:DUF45 domain-containing protein [Candidatus Micrarchaeota archaeon]